MGTDDGVDISDMPPPPTADADISGMPSPTDLFKQHVGRAPESDDELESFKTRPWDFGIGDSGPSPLVSGVTGAAEEFAKMGTGAVAAIPAGVAYGGAALARAFGKKVDPDQVQRDVQDYFTYRPHSEEAEAAEARLAQTYGPAWRYITQAADKAAGRVGQVSPTAEALLRATPGAAQAALGVLPAADLARGVTKALPREPGAGLNAEPEAGGASPPATTVATPAIEGPVTGAELRAQRDPLANAAPAPASAEQPPAPSPVAALAPTAPETSTRVPGKPHITLKASAVPSNPAPEPPPVSASMAASNAPVEPSPAAYKPPETAPRFTPPTAEGAKAGALPQDAQAARIRTLQDLNTLAGGQLNEVRTSAITGDTGEAGADFQHNKIQDAGGRRMQGVIAGETNALRSATDNLADKTGSTADGVDQPALRQRGTVIAGTVGKIEKWFDDNIQNVYETAKQRARGIPIPNMSRVSALLGDESEFAGTTEGEALYRGVIARARKLGIVGNDGVFRPSTVEQAEQLRQFLGERWTPQAAPIISKLRTALDMDVAEHGGADLFQRARQLRASKGTLLEDPTGIAQLRHPDDRLGINRAVPLEQVPDYVTNLAPDQFNHVINVLKSSAHLGGGELAEDAAAAIREIKGHMAAKLQEAGGAKIQGGWDAKSLYKQLNAYANKMPAVFSSRELQQWKTVNDASNVLRMDRTYPGAAAQLHNVGFRERLGNTAEGLISDLVPPGVNTIGELTGVSQKLRDTFKGNPEAKRLAEIEKRITKLSSPESSTSATLGQRIGGAKQRGGPKFTPKLSTPLKDAPEGDRPNPIARQSAIDYAKSAGIPHTPLSEYRYVPPEVAEKVAQAYEDMKHAPTDPKVKASYDAFKRETKAQWNAIAKTGLKVDFNQPYPYSANPRMVQEDVRANNHMSVFPTEEGFGTEASADQAHPMLEKSGVKFGGKEVSYNDLFRIVHDYYGHIAEGNGFRANGEYNAWRAHRQMYTPAAQPAMDSETLGQNSWVNSGPRAKANAGASQEATTYAEQKAGLLPPDVVKEAEPGVGSTEYHVTNKLTPEERTQLQQRSVQKLVDSFHALPPTEEYAAAALGGKAKKGWYENSARAIANVFGPDSHRFAALLAAMSPRISVEGNLTNALRTFVNWDRAGRPSDPTRITSIMKESSNGGQVLNAWVNNGIRALTADDPEKLALSGPKVHSFMRNLQNNVNEVTNDAWMAAFAKIDPTVIGGSGKLPKSGGPGKGATYLALSAKVRAAANMLTKLTGESWTPREVQETVWSWAKTAFEHAEELGDTTIPELLKQGKITDELIRGTPDFHQLFGTDEYRGLLQGSRYAIGLDKGEGAAGHITGHTSEKSAAIAKTLEPHLAAAARRLESVRQGRAVTPDDEEVPF